MKLPANAIPDKIEITFSYIKDGTVLKFSADSVPTGFNAKEYTEGLDESEDLPDGNSRVIKVYVKAVRRWNSQHPVSPPISAKKNIH
jgi:hypothetical protein